MPWGPKMSRLSTTIGKTAMPAPAIHPDKHLAERLRELKMSASAPSADEPHHRNSECPASDKRDAALRLAHFCGTIAEFWLNLQKLHELRLAGEVRRDDQIRCRRLKPNMPTRKPRSGGEQRLGSESACHAPAPERAKEPFHVREVGRSGGHLDSPSVPHLLDLVQDPVGTILGPRQEVLENG